MHRAQAVPSKLLSRKWEEKQHEIHLKHLREMKKTIHIQEPNQFKFLESKAKRTQMLEDRCTEIRRENMILLQKMTQIISSKQQPATLAE
jgi:hypothetical protein